MRGDFFMTGTASTRFPVADGGHIENLAVYELLRRRVRFIVCVDGGQEPGMECSDLVRLQRYAEIQRVNSCWRSWLITCILRPSDEPQTCQPTRDSCRCKNGARHLACLTPRFEEPAQTALIITRQNNPT